MAPWRDGNPLLEGGCTRRKFGFIEKLKKNEVQRVKGNKNHPEENYYWKLLKKLNGLLSYIYVYILYH